MSVKAMSLVWEIPCPSTFNEIEFKPGHKYVLIAYADHADQSGKNIYPAVETIAKKTGYEARSVQRLTRELEEMGILVPDGSGPRGTNRFSLPFSRGGDKISPLTNRQGDKSEKSLGDIPSGDIPSGDKLSPELNNLNPQNLSISNNIKSIWGDTKDKLKGGMEKAHFETWVADTETLGLAEGGVMVVMCRNAFAKDWLVKNTQKQASEASGYYVAFVVEADLEAVMA